MRIERENQERRKKKRVKINKFREKGKRRKDDMEDGERRERFRVDKF